MPLSCQEGQGSSLIQVGKSICFNFNVESVDNNI
jgi:hypothetical protein